MGGFFRLWNALIHRRHTAHIVNLHRDAVVVLLGGESYACIDVIEAAESRFIGGENDAVIACLPDGYHIIGDGIWSPVEDENQVTTLINDGFVVLVGQQQPCWQGVHHNMVFLKI